MAAAAVNERKGNNKVTHQHNNVVVVVVVETALQLSSSSTLQQQDWISKRLLLHILLIIISLLTDSLWRWLQIAAAQSFAVHANFHLSLSSPKSQLLLVENKKLNQLWSVGRLVGRRKLLILRLVDR